MRTGRRRSARGRTRTSRARRDASRNPVRDQKDFLRSISSLVGRYYKEKVGEFKRRPGVICDAISAAEEEPIR
jgi:hypothetical protein